MRTIGNTNGAAPARQGSSTLGVWLGAWGIVVSLICLYVALDARNVAKDAERRLERNVELIEESRAKIERMETSIRESIDLGEQRIREIAFKVEKNENRVRLNTEQLASTREVASQLIDSLTGQKEALTELATRIPALPRDVRTERTRTATGGDTTAPQPDQSGGDQTESAPTDTAPTYTVQSGDTLVDIARRKNLSVPDLLDANPDIDPNVIRVGQILNLPK